MDHRSPMTPAHPHTAPHASPSPMHALPTIRRLPTLQFSLLADPRLLACRPAITTPLILLIDAENINAPEVMADLLRALFDTGRIQRAVAVLPRRASRLRDILPGQGVEILPRLPDMPKNAADAMLMMVASREAAMATQTSVPLTFVFVSNDNGFGGAAEVLRQSGHRCWRMATVITERSAQGFDEVVRLGPEPALAPAKAQEPIVMPANLLPCPAMNLADFGQHLRKHYPELRRQLRRISKRLSIALERFAGSHAWPLIIERDGAHGSVVHLRSDCQGIR